MKKLLSHSFYKMYQKFINSPFGDIFKTTIEQMIFITSFEYHHSSLEGNLNSPITMKYQIMVSHHHIVSLITLCHSSYCVTHHIVSLITLCHSSYCVTHHIVSLITLCHSSHYIIHRTVLFITANRANRFLLFKKQSPVLKLIMRGSTNMMQS